MGRSRAWGRDALHQMSGYSRMNPSLRYIRKGLKVMTINQLSYLITIAETGSLNKAAELLYISQPSLSGAVQELEKELGIIIFRRTGRGVTLTTDGAEFLL